ncbi:sugar phosphate isomerase/epimerase family protein [Pinibacter aurantiacus]|uniref:Sugar phosphate isomerase/epimerase n=1 Tax=Pinibacter aurantiacus TaxID=2851599 RepID=A0A9E2S974_9BACT|nr:sugar phosphate isomerase/epimerase [Pinibacter aurantiacus]MBV4358226.1 sugar phosphate isomerase/epimerase [Pinibacter aurantiacus]
MQVQFFCPRWGSENIQWDVFCKKVKEAGYDGIEYGIGNTASAKELDEVWNVAEKYKLKIIAQSWENTEADFSKHLECYHGWLEMIKPYPIVKIDSQTGRDFFSFEHNSALIAEATRFTNDTGIQVAHETHRNKLMFAAHISKDYLERIPEMRITLDASHWVCVAESFLEDQPAAIQLAIEKTIHLHARVGYPEGPQIPDPRVKEWEPALEKHLEWWDKVAALKTQQNEVLTITPEFGPYPYMVHDPASGQPIADQWSVNVFMMNLLKQRYQ